MSACILHQKCTVGLTFSCLPYGLYACKNVDSYGCHLSFKMFQNVGNTDFIGSHQNPIASTQNLALGAEE